MGGLKSQQRRYGKYEFRRLMQDTRRNLDIENLRPEFEIVLNDPVFQVKCRRCGQVFRLNQRGAQLSHAARHTVADRMTTLLTEETYWWLKVKRRHWRRVEIVRAEPGRGWLVQECPFVLGCRRWWVRNPENFGGKVEDD